MKRLIKFTKHGWFTTKMEVERGYNVQCRLDGIDRAGLKFRFRMGEGRKYFYCPNSYSKYFFERTYGKGFQRIKYHE